MRLKLIPILLLFINISFGQKHWESIVLASDTFSYHVASSEPDANWKKLDFDANSWPLGRGGFGYDDDDDNTIIEATTSVYLRKTFNVADTSSIKTSLFYMDYDDGFVAYLNGKEVARSTNLTDDVPKYNSTLNANHEAGTPERFEIDINDFKKGTNLLAVQVLNRTIESSDLSSNVFLYVEIDSPDSIYSAIPDWFVPPITFSSSNLPIVLIQTNGVEIVDEPKIMAEMKICNNADGVTNTIAGPFTEYDGKIAIELRGESTLGKPKKSYRLETQLENGDNNNVSILGMPKENDWILYGPYMDKTFLRNDISFFVSDVLDQYATRRQFCELLINDEYLGVYLFEEKIKVDNNRVDVAKLKPEDIEGDQLTGGYIFRSDKSDPGYSYFSSGVDYLGEEANKLQFYDPTQEELADVQKDYLKQYIKSFEESLVGANFEDPNSGYNNYVNVGSFIDYLVSSEIALEQDRYRFSTYFHKEKESNGGKIYAGPIWDSNYGFGLSKSWDYIQNADVWGYQYAPNHIYWWRRMMEDSYFENLFYTRWTSQRTESLSDSSLMHYVDSMAMYLDEAQIRNFQRWPIQGVYVFPNKFTGETYQEDIAYLKDWILVRSEWVDSNITGELLSPTVSLEVENNYFNKDTFSVKLELVEDYFNRKIFKNKHFKLNDDGPNFKKDTILFTDASSALIKIVNANPGTKLPAGFSITVDEKVINSFNDITTSPLGLELNYDNIAVPEPSLTVYINRGEIFIKSDQPKYLGSTCDIYNAQGIKIAEEALHPKYLNRVSVDKRSLFLIVRIMYNGKPKSYKLFSN